MFCEDMNSGYAGWSMSKRACLAYEMGEKPLSRWTKRAIVDAVAELAPALVEAAKAASRADLVKVCLAESSRHHTGKVPKLTVFYEVREDLDGMGVSDFMARVEASKASRRALAKTDASECRLVLAFWEDFENVGSKRHPRWNVSAHYEILEERPCPSGTKGVYLFAPRAYKYSYRVIRVLDGKERDFYKRLVRIPGGYTWKLKGRNKGRGLYRWDAVTGELARVDSEMHAIG